MTTGLHKVRGAYVTIENKFGVVVLDVNLVNISLDCKNLTCRTDLHSGLYYQIYLLEVLSPSVQETMTVWQCAYMTAAP